MPLAVGRDASRSSGRLLGAACLLLAILALAAFSGCSSLESVTAGGRYNPVTGETGGEVSVRLRSRADGKTIKPLSDTRRSGSILLLTPTQRLAGLGRAAGSRPSRTTTDERIELPGSPFPLFRTTRQMPLRPLPAAPPEPVGPRIVTYLADR